ncbi:50S ribosomal protein L13 [candidate division MSBL1 archaeon SCGC-AAA259E17]|uniref:Large ribosomal subunit protein uL13 n=1 Tax=candidate division MSBL1 archaeon SCGC-AAA259E17 TaxID=1698263 RepID=A0A133UCK4_9EURY|nr:50S ribosomal protein L13 [candidate division MSBL1 archaeon SCGC-AAA259E17]
MMIVDATDLVLGRISSQIAKELLEGKEVTVVNADKAVISGRKKSTLSEYDAWTEIRSLVDPNQGPFHPRSPGSLIRKTVRGMLPMKKQRGRSAYDRLEAHSGIPSELEDEEMETFPEANVSQLDTRRFIRVGELSKHLQGGE